MSDEPDEIDEIIARMSDTQRDVLIRGSLAFFSIRFATGEAMRRLGLLTRTTLFVLGSETADEQGVYTQWRNPARKPRACHEWHFTPKAIEAGRRLKDVERGVLDGYGRART